MPWRKRTSPDLTRRGFLAAGAIGAAAIAAGCDHSSGHGNWDSFTKDQARLLAVLCDQIIPADDFRSASQAGVLTYIDKQLARHYKRDRDAYRDGLEQAEAMSRKSFGHALTELNQAQQFEIARAMEQQNRPFFELVRKHTMEGYYGSPRHGGNRDAVSWHMLGLDEPPLRGRAQYDLTGGNRS